MQTTLNNIDIRLLRIFKAIAESGGIAAAETTLNISRPAISTALSDLETRLGLNLASRGRGGFALTDEGEAVYAATLQLLTSLDTFGTHVNALHAQLRGSLNIGITDNLVTHEAMKITHALTELKREGDAVEINITMAPPAEIRKQVRAGALHVGVIPNPGNQAHFNYRALYEETTLLYCAAGRPVTAENVAHYDAVRSSQPASAALQDMESQLNHTATATDREGVAFLILTGRYIGFLPDHFAKRWVMEGRMQAVDPQRWTASTHYAVITRSDAQPNRIVERFLAHVD